MPWKKTTWCSKKMWTYSYFELFEVTDSREIHWGLDFQPSLLGLLLKCVLQSPGLENEMVAAFLFEENGPCSLVLESPTLSITPKGSLIWQQQSFLMSVHLQENHSLMQRSLGQFPAKEICKHVCVRCSAQTLGPFHGIQTCGSLNMPKCLCKLKVVFICSTHIC